MCNINVHKIKIIVLSIIFLPFVDQTLLAFQLPDSEKVHLLGGVLRFVDCQNIHNQKIAIDDWDKNTVARNLSVSYGIKPAFGWFSSESIPVAIQTIALGKYFCLFDCRTAIKDNILNGLCEPIAVVSPCGWSEQLQKTGFCFYLNAATKNETRLFYIAKVVGERANMRFFHQDQNEPHKRHIVDDQSCIRSSWGGGVDNDISYSAARLPSFLEWINSSIFYLRKNNHLSFVSYVPDIVKKSTEIQYHSDGLSVKQGPLFIYDSPHCIYSDNSKQIQSKSLPLFSQVRKQDRFFRPKKNMTMHVIGQYINNKKHMVLFDCTQLMRSAAYEDCCKPVAVINSELSKIDGLGIYEWRADSGYFFHIQKIVNDHAIFYHGNYPITFYKDVKKDKTEFYNKPTKDFDQEFPMLCGGSTSNEGLSSTSLKITVILPATVNRHSNTILASLLAVNLLLFSVIIYELKSTL